MKNYTLEELKGLQEKGFAWISPNGNLMTNEAYDTDLKRGYEDNQPECTFAEWCEGDTDVVSIEAKINELEFAE